MPSITMSNPEPLHAVRNDIAQDPFPHSAIVMMLGHAYPQKCTVKIATPSAVTYVAPPKQMPTRNEQVSVTMHDVKQSHLYACFRVCMHGIINLIFFYKKLLTLPSIFPGKLLVVVFVLLFNCLYLKQFCKFSNLEYEYYLYI